MNAQQEKSFARFIARLIELGVITVEKKEVQADVEVTEITVTYLSQKGITHDTPNSNLR